MFVFLPERPVADNERMFDVLQRFGSQRHEVRFFLRHERPPGRDLGRCTPGAAAGSELCVRHRRGTG